MSQEKIDIADSVGCVVVKGGALSETPQVLPETSEIAPEAPTSPIEEQAPATTPEIEYEDVSLTLKLYKPIKQYIDNQVAHIKDATKEEIYASLVHDAFRMHFNKMCPHCGVTKLEWEKERQHQRKLAKTIQRLKAKKIKKMQKEARRKNRV